MPKTRKERRIAASDAYLSGRARRAHINKSDVRRSLNESCTSESQSDPVCSQCAPVLSRYELIINDLTCIKCHIIIHRYTTTFKEMIHQGSDLIRKKSINPHPVKSDRTHYRNVVKQNEWLKENIFDAVGNYLYCQACVRSSFSISADRLARQRRIKCQMLKNPIVKMKKSEIIDKHLGDFIVMPPCVSLSFNKWWVTVDPTTEVDVRFPHERHGLAGIPSNQAKTAVKEAFLDFVDNNSQPNGRSEDSSGPTFYFSPKFNTIQTPKPTVAHYEERLGRSVVGEFNRYQREIGKGECSNGSSHNWLKTYRPKVAICPHQEDYCDNCSKFKASIHSQQTTLNRVIQSTQASSHEIEMLKEDLKKLKDNHETHRLEAQKSHSYYTEVTNACAREWDAINSLERKSVLTDEETNTLAGLKNKFTTVICADYQMAKLTPYWGLSAQPGATYYLQKLTHDVFGIVNHATGSSTVYLFDERAGPKNTDHTISYLTDYLSKLPGWNRRIHIFLDNTCSTNKNFYLMSWAYEMIQQSRLRFLRISFLLAGHTKFSPDLLFSKVAKAYNRSDVFNTSELSHIIAPYSEVVVDNGALVADWRDVLSKKYSKLPGIQKLHDFIYVKNPVTSNVVAKVRHLCYTGSYENSTSHVLRSIDPCFNVIPDLGKQSYTALSKTRNLTDSKTKHLKQMYADYIAEDRWPEFLNRTDLH